MAYRPQSRGCVKLVDVEGWFDDDDDGAGGGDDDNYDDDADVLLSSTKVCLPIPYTIRPKTLPHKMTRQPRVHTNPNAKTAEPSKRLINKNAIVPPHSNIGFIARKCSVEKRFSFREK